MRLYLVSWHLGGHSWSTEDDCMKLSVHGGVTFRECFHPETNEDTETQWIGFDCAHYTDRPDFESLERYGMENPYPEQAIEAFLYNPSLCTWKQALTEIETKALAERVQFLLQTKRDKR